MNELANVMKYSETINVYERYDGRIHVKGYELDASQKMVFDILPDTNIKSFSYTAQYVIPNFSCFVGVPRSLKTIELSNWRGVSDTVIKQLISQGVRCTTPYDAIFQNLNYIVYSDSGKYKCEGGYWIRCDEHAKRVPNGYLYCVKDSCWKNKFKIGHTIKTTEDVRKYLMTRYQTPLGKGNVVIVKLVPIFGDVLKAKRNMLSRFGARNGVVVTGDEEYVKSKVF